MKDKQKSSRSTMDRKYYISLLLVLLLCFLPRLVLALKVLPLRTKLDELGTMAGAAYFAGLNWGEVMKQTSYYGAGFTSLFAFVFRLTDNPVIIYRVIVCSCAFLQAVTGCICYAILHRFFQMKSDYLKIVGSVAASYFVMTRAMIVYNEHVLIFLTWVIMYLVLSMIFEENENRVGKSIALGVVLGYSLTIHTRAITFSIAVILLLLLMRILSKERRMVAYIPFFVSWLISVIAAKCFVHWIQRVVWHLDEVGHLVNAEINVTSNLGNLLDSDAWRGMIYTALGQIRTIGMVSVGMTTLLVVMFFSLCIRMKKNGFDTRTLALFLNLLFCVFCVAFTIAGQSYLWSSSTAEVIRNGYEGHLYGLKAFTYIRYFGPYCGPLVISLIVMLEDDLIGRRELILSAGLSLLGELLWFFVFVPYFVNPARTDIIESLFCFGWGNKSSTIDTRFFLICMISVISLMTIDYIFIGLKRKRIVLTFLCVLFLFQYIYNANMWDYNGHQVSSYASSDATYGLIKELEKTGELPEKIYMIADGKEIHQFQFMLNRYTIIPTAPEKEPEEATLVLSNHKWKERGKYKEYKIDTREYVYVYGKKLRQRVKEAISTRAE